MSATDDDAGFQESVGPGLTYHEFLAASTKHKGLWEGIYSIARLPEWAVTALPPGMRRHLLVIAEDWCGDASSTTPLVAKLADEVPGLELRILRRDEYPEVMDRYLTNGSRSIPIVIALDEEFRELGHWGPRPARAAVVARTAVNGERDLIAHRARRHEQRRLLAQQLRHHRLEAVHGRVFAVLLVAHIRLGHGAPHRGCRAGDRIAEQVDGDRGHVTTPSARAGARSTAAG